MNAEAEQAPQGGGTDMDSLPALLRSQARLTVQSAIYHLEPDWHDRDTCEAIRLLRRVLERI